MMETRLNRQQELCMAVSTPRVPAQGGSRSLPAPGEPQGASGGNAPSHPTSPGPARKLPEPPPEASQSLNGVGCLVVMAMRLTAVPTAALIRSTARAAVGMSSSNKQTYGGSGTQCRGVHECHMSAGQMSQILGMPALI